MRPTISLCMIVRDEEANLAHCIASVREVVTEIVVVDTGSTDATKAIASGLGGRVFDFSWQNSFADARNESLRRARGDWILWMDADDRLGPESRENFANLARSLGQERIAYAMSCESATPSGEVTIAEQIRLFRADPMAAWAFPVHEQILPSLRAAGYVVRSTNVRIRHTGYLDAEVLARKQRRNLRILEGACARTPNDPFLQFQRATTLVAMDRAAEALQALECCQPAHLPESAARQHFALRGAALRDMGELGRALGAVRAGRAHYPADTELLFLEAHLLLERGDAAGAESAVRRLLEEGDSAPFATQTDRATTLFRARFLLGVSLRYQGRFEAAETELRQILAQRRNFGPAWLVLGEVYEARREPRALGDALRAIDEVGFEDPGVWPLRVQSALFAGDSTLAQSLVHDGLRRYPEHPVLLALRGTVATATP